MEQFSQKIKDEYFPHTNVEVFANNSRLVIELKMREIFSYKPNEGELVILDPIPIDTGNELIVLFEKARLRGDFDGEDQT